MIITEVRIKLMSANNDRLRAFCSITIDNDFVIRDLKVIEGSKGPFVAMPSRKLMGRCSRCSGKNHYHARYCNECGARLQSPKESADPESRLKLHADIAHPINSKCRELIQRRILEEYGGEIEKSKDPSYQPTALDVFEEDYLEEVAVEEGPSYTETQSPAAYRPAASGSGALAHEPLRMHTDPLDEDSMSEMESSPPGEDEAGRRQVAEGLEPPARGPVQDGGWSSRGPHTAREGRDARPPRGRPGGEGRSRENRFGGGRSAGPPRPDGRAERHRGSERNAPLPPVRGERGADGRRGRRDEPLEVPRRQEGPRPFSTARSAGAPSREEDVVLDRTLDEAGRERTPRDAGYASAAPRQRAPAQGAKSQGALSREPSATDGGEVSSAAPPDARIDPRERERLDRTEPEDNFGAGLFS